MAKANLDDFSGYAQRVWADPTTVGKQAVIIEMIDACHSSIEKKNKLKREVGCMTNTRRLDKFAADLMLVDTDRRIK